MKEETSMNVWKESFPAEIRFLTRNNDLRKVAGNWTRPETGPHTVVKILSTVTFCIRINVIYCKAFLNLFQ